MSQDVSFHMFSLIRGKLLLLVPNSCWSGDGGWGFILCCPGSISDLGTSFVPVSQGWSSVSGLATSAEWGDRWLMIWTQSSFLSQGPCTRIYLFFCFPSLMNLQLSLRKTGAVILPLVASGFCSIWRWFGGWRVSSAHSSGCGCLHIDLHQEEGFLWFSAFPQIFVWGLF